MSRERPIRALLLDLDGTLCDTHELIYTCVRDTLQERAGFDFTRGHWQRMVGLPLHEVYAACQLEHPDLLPANELLTAHYRALQRERDHGVRLFPGVLQALERLRERGVKLAVVTTKHVEAATRTLHRTGLDRLLDAVVTGDQCRSYKPHPEPYITGAQRLGVQPEECAGVGDSPHDIVSAREAGAVTVAALWGTLDAEAVIAEKPDRVLWRPEELEGLVRA